MNCHQETQQLGSYLDGELPSSARDLLEAHLASCSACRSELESLRGAASEVAAIHNVPVPDTLWTAIQRRLDDSHPSSAPADLRPTGSTLRRKRVRRLPLALAAAVGLAVGLGMLSFAWTDSRVQASTIDFTSLLDALPLDPQKAFRKFLVLYGAKEGSPFSAKRYAPELNFNIPQMLPGGFRLEAVYLLRFGKLPGVATTYDRDGEFLGAVFHRPVNKENYGPHQDYPCVIGRHEGYKVVVGEWKLVHLTDPTTCHCVLSRLDEQTELPGIMAAVAPGLAAADTKRHEH